MNILAIESSCDETAAAVVKDGTVILSTAVASSADMHARWGGIVPEVAARKQLEYIIPVLTAALSPLTDRPTQVSADRELFRLITDRIDAVAVTVGPGLVGSLLIGIEAAKCIGWLCDKPMIPVNHVLAHMYANFVADGEIGLKSRSARKQTGPEINNGESIGAGSLVSQSHIQEITFPAISLVVSGGHTELYLMESPKILKWLGGTLDDAAGECLDKTARLIGLGAGGGLAIQNTACTYRPEVDIKFKLPRPLSASHDLNFSFSGLKTAVLREWTKYQGSGDSVMDPRCTPAFANEIQEAVTDVLTDKTANAVGKYHAKSALISGGVAANLRLREKLKHRLAAANCNLYVPPVALCTDNAVYIAAYAYFRGQPTDWQSVTAQPDLTVEVAT